MLFEYIFAYMENARFLGCAGLVLSIVAIALLIVARIHNEVDKDDWIYLMFFIVPIFFISLILVLSPGIDHVLEVNAKIRSINQTKENVSESPVSGHSLSVIYPTLGVSR